MGSSLTEKEELGRIRIKEGIEEKNWMLYSSDKSGKLVSYEKENYNRAQLKHASKDKVATLEEFGVSGVICTSTVGP